MIKISALNTDTSSNTDTDDDVQKISKEALEETALNLYNKSLICQRNGEIDEALYLLKEITEEYLKKLEEKDGLSKPLLNLKYSCCRNIAGLFYKKEIIGTALDYYLDAAEIDSTDVVLWNRIGDLAVKIEDFYLAIHAFKQGLVCNPKHWPCLDKVIMLLYAIRENVGCLSYISQALQLDPAYIRGLVIRKTLYKYNKAIQPYYEIHNPKHVYDPPLDTVFDIEEGHKLIDESEEIANIIRKQTANNKLPDIPPTLQLVKPLEEYTWLAVGNVLLHMHQYIKDNNYSFFSPVELNKILNVPKKESSDTDELVCTENKTVPNTSLNDDSNINLNSNILETNEIIANEQITSTEKIHNDQMFTLSDFETKMDVSENIINEIVVDMSVDIMEKVVNEDGMMVENENDKYVVDETIIENTEIETEVENGIKSYEKNNTNDDIEMMMENDKYFVNETVVETTVLENEMSSYGKSENIFNIDSDNLALIEMDVTHDILDNNDENQIIDVENEKSKSEILNESSNDNIYVMNMQTESFENQDEFNKGNALRSDPDIEEELVKITSELEKSEENGELISQELEESEEEVVCETFVTSVPDIDAELKTAVVENIEKCFTEVQDNPQPVMPDTETKKIESDGIIDPESQNEKNDSKVNEHLTTLNEPESTEKNKSEESKGDKSSGNESKSTDFEKPKGHALKSTSRRRRSSLSMLEIWGWHSKRKSNRSKSNNATKEDRNDSIEGVLKRILPDFLIPDGIKSGSGSDTPSSEKENELSISTKQTNKELNPESYFGTEKETNDVKIFWERFAIYFKEEKFAFRCDIVTLLEFYIPAIAEKWQYTWPHDLIVLYLELYQLYRLYIHHPCVLDYCIASKEVCTDAYITLLYGELFVNEWLTSNGEANYLTDKCLPAKSLSQLEFATGREAEWESNFVSYMIRVYWLKLLLYINQSKNNEAIGLLKDILHYLSIYTEAEKYFIHLPNCTKNPIVNQSIFKKILQSLERYQNLCTIVEQYEKRLYLEIIPILKETLNEEIKESDPAPKGADRPMQIAMLLESLWFLDNLQECVIWAENSLNEAVQKYLNLSSDSEKYDRWKLIILKCLASIEGCIKEREYFILSEFMEDKLPRLVSNLARIICYQVEKLEHSSEFPLNTVTPWILLHYVLQQEEDRGRIKLNVEEKRNNISEDDEDDDYIPPSIMILFSGHEFLGKHKLCSLDNGELLIFTLDVVMPRLRSPMLEPIREKINHHLEQIFFCLYQHPSKKSNKIRHLIDHNVQPQKMCWERAQQLYDFYRPEDLPDFDAYKLSSINSETEGLLKRVVHLVPTEQDPQVFVADMLAFIDGQTHSMPNVTTPLPVKMLGLYYLLADYYLKSNEFPKALKYYTMDVCINPQRLDSWAGMALARASQLETKLNSCEPFGEAEFVNKSRAVQNCFKQSVQISPNHLKLWIEYGSFVYSAHSFCSRLLKTEADSLSMERFETLESQKDELLNSALECFTSADAIWQHQLLIGEQREQDERWLHQYMQGKIAEKQAKEPPIYMGHYLKANELLYENYAEYPLKINYNNPSTLSVEALELHYRIHASILKYLERHEIQHVGKSIGRALSRYLRDCATGSFTTGVSKAEIERRKEDTAITDSEKNIEQIRKRSGSDSSSEEKAKRRRLNDLIEKPISDVLIKDKQISDVDTTNESDDEKSENSKKISKELVIKGKLEDPQEIMDRLMKQCMEEFGTADGLKKEVELKTDQNQCSNDETNKTTGVERRGSQESTVTTSTQATTATSTSSSDTSSSEGSSSSDSSSSDSDSSDTTENSKESSTTTKDEWLSASEMDRMITQCIRSLEQCICRFPQHYKALYRLAHHFFHRPEATRDLTKCRQLLLGQYRCHNGATVQGLFSERKNNNFFNGVWRIPVSEMDRPGSFAAHMSRCMTLLMQVLRASGDHRTLLELCIQLQRIPDADKKYLRDSEREQLSQQALSLCLQCLKELLRALTNGKFISTASSGTNTIVNEPPVPCTKPPPNNLDPNPAGVLLLDIYRAYQKAQKHLIQKESLFANLLVDTYKQYMTGKINDVNLDTAIKFCQQRIAANRSAQQINSQTSTSLPSTYIQQGNVSQSIQQTVTQRKTSSTKSTSVPGMRPRGRPPNIKPDNLNTNRINKYPLNPALNPLNLPPQSSLGYYPFHPMFLSAAMGTNLDPTTAALSMMMSNYQELMRQYNTNLPISSLPPVTNPVTKTTTNFTTVSSQNPPLYGNEIQQSTLTTQNIDTSYPTKDLSTSVTALYNKSTVSHPKEIPKSKHVASKESILKAVYGKDKSLKSKDLNTYKKDTPVFKEQHGGLSITPLIPTGNPNIKLPPHIPTSPSKTLQQKLAERQKQNPAGNSPSKINLPPVDLRSTPSNSPHFLTSNHQPSFSNPPAAHSHNTYKQIPASKHATPLPAHSASSLIKKSQLQPTSKQLNIPSTHNPTTNKSKTQSLKTIMSEIPSIPSSLTITKTQPIPQPLQQNINDISITQVKAGNDKSQTSKLLHFRKPVASVKQSLPQNKNTVSGNFPLPLTSTETMSSKIQTQNYERIKNQESHPKPAENVEIITLDD